MYKCCFHAIVGIRTSYHGLLVATALALACDHRIDFHRIDFQVVCLSENLMLGIASLNDCWGDLNDTQVKFYSLSVVMA